MQPSSWPLSDRLPTGEFKHRRECWDARSLPIREISKGYLDSDACRVDQALVCDYRTSEFYDAKDKPIRNIAPGTKSSDAIRYDQAVLIINNELFLNGKKCKFIYKDENNVERDVHIRLQLE